MPKYRIGKWKIRSAVLVVVLILFSVKTWQSLPTEGNIAAEAGEINRDVAYAEGQIDTDHANGLSSVDTVGE